MSWMRPWLHRKCCAQFTHLHRLPIWKYVPLSSFLSRVRFTQFEHKRFIAQLHFAVCIRIGKRWIRAAKCEDQCCTSSHFPSDLWAPLEQTDSIVVSASADIMIVVFTNNHWQHIIGCSHYGCNRNLTRCASLEMFTFWKLIFQRADTSSNITSRPFEPMCEYHTTCRCGCETAFMQSQEYQTCARLLEHGMRFSESELTFFCN